MPKFFQTEIAGYGGDKNTFQNVKFKKRDFSNTSAAAAGTILEIIPVHIKNPPVIQFLAYVSTLGDSYSVKYKSEQPYGRTDQYHIWSGNMRRINLSFDIPSSSVSKGLDNLNNLSWLLASLYPTYKDRISSTSVSASPLFRVRYGNLIMSPAQGGLGLLCTMPSVRVTHDHKEGFIGVVASGMSVGGGNTAGSLLKSAGFDNSVREGEKILIPKLIKISTSLTVVNDHPMGWDHQTGHWRGGPSAAGWPYKFGLVRDTKDEPSASSSGAVNEDSSVPTPNPDVPPSPPGSPDAQQANNSETILSDTNEDVGVERSWWDTTADAMQGKVEVGGKSFDAGFEDPTWEGPAMGHTGM